VLLVHELEGEEWHNRPRLRPRLKIKECYHSRQTVKHDFDSKNP
jgi:hypothetical protein